MTPARGLVVPSARMVALAPVGVAMLLAVAGVLTAGTDVTALLLRLRGTTLLLGVAVVFALDDPAAQIADTTPIPRWLRAFVRAGVQLVPAALAWAVVLLLASARSAEPLPALWLSVEALTLAIVGWAVAASWRRVSGDLRAGAIAGPVLVVLVLGAHRLPSRWSLFTGGPADAMWQGAQWRLAGVLTGAVVLLLAALSDPASARGPASRLAAAARRGRSRHQYQ